MKVKKSNPIGFCNGVTKAIELVKEIREKYKDRNIFFVGNLVHNKHVVDNFLEQKIQIINLDDNVLNSFKNLKSDDIVIFSAHGHNLAYEEILKEKGITFYDATCVKVKAILAKISEFCGEIIYIGKKNHPETEASLTYSKKIFLYDINEKFDYSKLKTDNPLIVNQSTLSFLELENIFKDIKNNVKNPIFSNEICGATRIRQEQILHIDEDVDLLIIVGDKTSNNSLKLYEIACNNLNVKTLFVNSANELKTMNLHRYKHALITSGTSASMDTILEIEDYLRGI